MATPRVSALSLTLLALVGCASPPPLAEGTVPAVDFDRQQSLAPYTLGPGDLLRLTVFNHPEIAPPEFPLRIDPQGRLSLPLTGAVVLEGLTVEEARAAIESSLAQYLREPAVGLSVEAYAARQAFVLGEVNRPGAFVLDRPLTALQVLSLAGGIAPDGDKRDVALLREREGEMQIHFFDAGTPGLDGLVVVEPDDLLFVRQSGAGAFKEQILPVLQGIAPILGSITNLVVLTEALEDDN
ncbi:MAG: polysaccharide biosynthesis/export family protein [Planctomycetota bacterium]